MAIYFFGGIERQRQKHTIYTHTQTHSYVHYHRESKRFHIENVHSKSTAHSNQLMIQSAEPVPKLYNFLLISFCTLHLFRDGYTLKQEKNCAWIEMENE